jgi:hypothetical protein
VGLAALRRHVAWRWPLVALLCLGLGAARYQADRPIFDASFITAYADHGVGAVEGVASAEPSLTLLIWKAFFPETSVQHPVRGQPVLDHIAGSGSRRQT